MSNADIAIEFLKQMDGNEFLDLSIAVLVRLRKAFHSDDVKQENINIML